MNRAPRYQKPSPDQSRTPAVEPGGNLAAARFIKTTHRCVACRSVILQQTSAKPKGGASNTLMFECANFPACLSKCRAPTPRTICLCGIQGDGCEPGSGAEHELPGLPWSRKTPTRAGRYWFRAANAPRGAYFDVHVIDVHGVLKAAIPGHKGIKVELLDTVLGEWAGPLPLPFEGQ